MFATNDSRSVKRFSAVLGALNLVALLATIWVLVNVRHEQAAVADLINHLQGKDLQVASELSSELGLQRGLSLLLVVNVVAAAIALAFVVRGYFSTERDLEAVKGLAADILASMDEGVITTDMEGRILSSNPRGIELVGLSADSGGRISQSIYQVDSEHAMLKNISDEIRQHNQPIRDRDYRVNAQGHRKMFRAGCTMLKNRDNQQVGMVFHVRDVTEKSFIEERLRRMERYVGLGSLAAGLEHEIKNPLNALLLHIQLLCERLEMVPVDDEVNEMLEILETEVKRIANILDGFRNYASTQEIGRSPVDVPLLIAKLVRLLRPDAALKGVEMTIEVAEGSQETLPADAAQLEQVLLNLALNSIAAMPNGGQLKFSVSTQGETMRVDVTDTGKGIPLEIQPLVFDPYFTTRSDGIGMGLALCDKIVRQHDGNIEFQSGSHGTTFTLVLPISDA